MRSFVSSNSDDELTPPARAGEALPSQADNLSTTSNRSGGTVAQPVINKELKLRVKSLKSAEKAREFLFEHQEQLRDVPTPILNSWLTVDGYGFCRRKGTVLLECLGNKRYNTITAIRERQDRIEKAVCALILQLGGDPNAYGFDYEVKK
jgi:hypothetical protein